MDLSKDKTEYAVASLKKIMEARHIKQPQLEHLSGVNQSTISKILSRNTDPSYEILQKLFRGIGVPLTEILYDHDDRSPELYGYLATPLTGVAGNQKAESELLKVVELIKRTANSMPERMDLYWPGDHTHPLRNPEFTPEQVYLIDRSRASAYDFIVLFCAEPSYGVGQENEIATQSGLPAIRLAPANVSRMMSGSFLNAVTITYKGSLESGVSFDSKDLKLALEEVRHSYFRLKAFYKTPSAKGFGDRLRKLISDRAGDYGLLASELGLSRAYLNGLMNEEFAVSNPSGRILCRIAARLGTSVAYLLGESEETDPIWLTSHAAWRKWVDTNPGVDAALALKMRDDWRQDFHHNRAELSNASFRKASQMMNEVDWDRRYQSLMKTQSQQAVASKSPRGKATDGTNSLFQ